MIHAKYAAGDVLIETYWNVNADRADGIPVRSIVLIETYWNVNVAFTYIIGTNGIWY